MSRRERALQRYAVADASSMPDAQRKSAIGADGGRRQAARLKAVEREEGGFSQGEVAQVIKLPKSPHNGKDMTVDSFDHKQLKWVVLHKYRGVDTKLRFKGENLMRYPDFGDFSAFMQKRGGVRKNWLQRYFVYKGAKHPDNPYAQRLVYYEVKSGSPDKITAKDERGEILLYDPRVAVDKSLQTGKQVAAARVSQAPGAKGHEIEILTMERTLVNCHPSRRPLLQYPC